MNVIISNTCIKNHEKITDKELQFQWKSIDWTKAEKTVNRIQVRIVKAVREKKWNLVKRLQYLLTHSFYSKVLAIKRITSSKGKNTPGIDGIVWKSDVDKMRAVYLIVGQPLVLHSDNGSPMKAATFQATLEKLGVQSSFSRPRVSNDNPYSEALFKTMKYRPKYPYKGFINLDEARKWVKRFVNWYNNVHMHSGINFVTPYQRHYGLDKKIMEKRKETYENARSKHPERWSKNIRNWTLPKYVSLNPISDNEVNDILKESN